MQNSDLRLMLGIRQGELSDNLPIAFADTNYSSLISKVEILARVIH
jgi:hypothetical protein